MQTHEFHPRIGLDCKLSRDEVTDKIQIEAQLTWLRADALVVYKKPHKVQPSSFSISTIRNLDQKEHRNLQASRIFYSLFSFIKTEFVNDASFNIVDYRR